MPSFKDDSILIIAPGSRTTLAQLGLPESFTPARYRFRSRMFPTEQQGVWEPHKVRRKHREPNGDATSGDQKMDVHDQDEFEEDRNSDEGAVWPIQAGRVTNWSCFFALLEHVHKQIGPPFHTPILFIAQPVWTPREHEKITQFFFEKFSCPGFALVDSAVATAYAYGLETATIVDVGADKADITAIRDCVPSAIGRGVAVPGCGGEALTERLQELLGSRGFSRAMCEQLKQNPICEVLPAATPLPGSSQQPTENGHAQNPLTAASTGANEAGPDQRHTAGAAGQAPRGPGAGTEVGGDLRAEDDEGVLDVANIVTSGKMQEYLADKEQEKQARLVAKKKGDTKTDAAPKPVRLKNSDKEKATFYYEDHALLDALKSTDQSSSNISAQSAALDEAPASATTSATAPPPDHTNPTSSNQTKPHQAPRRELTVGTERFLPASGPFLPTLTSAIHRTIHSYPDPSARPALWNNLIIVGNGSAVRGLKERILETLNQRFLISPSSATMFTSELPSNFSTPAATGANTPQHGQQQGGGAHHGLPHHPHGGGVNPLLHAATTAAASGHANPTPAAYGQLHMPPPSAHTPQHPSMSMLAAQQHAGRGQHHAQAPTSIRVAKLPEYFLEWKEVGHEEAVFLGAQVAARVLFVVGGGGGQGQDRGFLSRSEYNEVGPEGVGEVVLGVGS